MAEAKTFEDCVVFIENQLGLCLLAWQKESLRMIYENKPCYFLPGRGCGLTVFNKAAKLLEELMEDNYE